MHKNITPIIIKQLGVNDLDANLIEWYVSEKSKVNIGDILCSVETTKATIDIESDYAGYIIFIVGEDTNVKVNDVIALVGENINELEIEKEKYKIIQEKVDNVVATKKAIKTAKSHGIKLSDIKINGIIKEVDVKNYIKTSEDDNVILIDFNKKYEENSLIIYGASKSGSVAKEVIELEKKYKPVMFLDDNRLLNNKLSGIDVYHSSYLNKLFDSGLKNIFCPIGNGEIRQRLNNKFEKIGFNVVNVIHPKSIIAPSVKFGKGVYIKAGAIIDSNNIISDSVIIDNGVVVAHDNYIGRGVHIAPGVSLGSSINIDEYVVIGIGSSLSTKLSIGSRSIISVGTSVVNNIPKNSIVEGVPGKVIGKRNI